MRMLEIKIEKVEDGYTLSWHEEIDDGKWEEKKKVVFGSDCTDQEEHEGLKNLLFTVAEYFGEHYDKWKDDNLNITFDRKGHYTPRTIVQTLDGEYL